MIKYGYQKFKKSIKWEFSGSIYVEACPKNVYGTHMYRTMGVSKQLIIYMYIYIYNYTNITILLHI